MEVIFLAATLLAAVTSTAFALRYGLRVRWESSPEGRSMFAGACATAFLSWAYALNRLDEALPDRDWALVTVPVRIVAWVTLAGVYVFKGRLLCVAQRKRWKR